MSDALDAAEITRGLQTRWLGQALSVKAKTNSTNSDCIALARAGAPAGSVVVADFQRAGRGRRGRQWAAPPGAAVLLSCLLRPKLPASAVGRLGMAGALAVVGALRQACGLEAAVKYPNDVLLSGRKVCGVLPEAHLSGGRVEWAVLGIGINVWPAAVPSELAARATSLAAHAPPLPRNTLIRCLLEHLEPRLEQADDNPEALAAAWRPLDVVLGRQVALTFGSLRREGLAADVDADGRLLLRQPNGAEEWLAPAEVTFRG